MISLVTVIGCSSSEVQKEETGIGQYQRGAKHLARFLVLHGVAS